MHIDSYQRILSNLQGNVRKVCFYILGEPFLNPDVFEIIRHTEQRGIATIISSNGMLIGKHISQILESGLSFLQVAIDGWSQETHAAHRVGADLEQIVANVKELHRERERRGLHYPMITIQTLVHKLNRDQLKDIEAFARSYADHFSLKKMMFGRTKKIIERNRIIFEPEDPYYQRTGDNAVYYRDMPLCPQLLQVNVLADGTVIPCCFDFDGTHPWGNLLEQPLSAILTGEPRTRFIEDFFLKRATLCARCDFVQDMQMRRF